MDRYLLDTQLVGIQYPLYYNLFFSSATWFRVGKRVSKSFSQANSSIGNNVDWTWLMMFKSRVEARMGYLVIAAPYDLTFFSGEICIIIMDAQITSLDTHTRSVIMLVWNMESTSRVDFLLCIVLFFPHRPCGIIIWRDTK